MPPKTKPLPKLTSAGVPLAPDIAASGPPVPPLKRLRMMEPEEWEDFVYEWAHHLEGTYALVEQRAGAGDQGIDIVAFPVEGKTVPWDNFQCKRYKNRLVPSDIWVEIGKTAFHAFSGAYELPRAYAFVAPLGAGNKLQKILKNPTELRAGLIKNWDEYCAEKITSVARIELTKELREYIDEMDFGIFSASSPLALIQQHADTPYHVFRFGGALPLRTPPPPPPSNVSGIETVYVRALLDAYEDKLGSVLRNHADIKDVDLQSHFSRCRREFYSAESLREFSRDNLPPDTFSIFLDELLDGIADAVQASHANGFARVLAVVQQAKVLQLTANVLITRTTATDRGGMCHQLANTRRVRWRP